MAVTEALLEPGPLEAAVSMCSGSKHPDSYKNLSTLNVLTDIAHKFTYMYIYKFHTDVLQAKNYK
jgi:hypothetical protein